MADSNGRDSDDATYGTYGNDTMRAHVSRWAGPKVCRCARNIYFSEIFKWFVVWRRTSERCGSGRTKWQRIENKRKWSFVCRKINGRASTRCRHSNDDYDCAAYLHVRSIRKMSVWTLYVWCRSSWFGWWWQTVVERIAGMHLVTHTHTSKCGSDIRFKQTHTFISDQDTFQMTFIQIILLLSTHVSRPSG